jgi:hypothetical protein
MRVLRVLLGVVAILVALPLLLGGVTLWAAMQHRAADGSFTAPLAPIPTTGYAVVVPDVDALLRQEAPFVRGGDTTLRFTAGTPTGAAFIGLAPRAAVERYLAGVETSQVTGIRLARGGLPVTMVTRPGTARPPSPPIDQTFWVVSSSSGTLYWSPSQVRSQQLALVVMAPDGAPPGEVSATAAMTPRWLDPTAWGLLILGTVAFLIGMVLLFWPRRHREIVYIVEPSQVPEIAARLGISTEPLAAALGGEPPSLDLFGDPEPADPGPEPEPVLAAPAWLVDPDGVQPPPRAVPAQPAPTPVWAGPTPVPVGPAGTYRSYSAPPTITPSFVWPPVTADR